MGFLLSVPSVPGSYYPGFRSFSQYMYDHNIIKRAQAMGESPRDDTAAVAFDLDFTQGLLAADAHCKNFKRSPWSPELHEAMTTKFIYL